MSIFKLVEKSAKTLINPKEYKEIRNKKGQPIPVDLSVLVEVAGFEPASVNPLPQALHA